MGPNYKQKKNSMDAMNNFMPINLKNGYHIYKILITKNDKK